MVAFPATDFTACGNTKKSKSGGIQVPFLPRIFSLVGIACRKFAIPITDFLWHLSREQGTPLEEPRRYRLVFLVEDAFSPSSV